MSSKPFVLLSVGLLLAVSFLACRSQESAAPELQSVEQVRAAEQQTRLADLASASFNPVRYALSLKSYLAPRDVGNVLAAYVSPPDSVVIRIMNTTSPVTDMSTLVAVSAGDIRSSIIARLQQEANNQAWSMAERAAFSQVSDDVDQYVRVGNLYGHATASALIGLWHNRPDAVRLIDAETTKGEILRAFYPDEEL